MNKINIAMDGPSGVGKSTIADILAEKFNMIHLDTGAMYRCVALYLKENNVNYDNQEDLKEALENISIQFIDGKTLLNDKDVTSQIRTNEISMLTSKVSAIGMVRKKLVSLQQQTTKNKGFIVDGRDICTVVLPDAEVKIYMDASVKARADRRYKEYIDSGVTVDYDTIYHDIEKRDYQDSHREISPLQKAKDAIVVDTSNLSIDEVVDEVMNIIKKIL